MRFILFILLSIINTSYLFSQSIPTINGTYSGDIYAFQINIGDDQPENYSPTINIEATDGSDVTYILGQDFSNGTDNFIEYSSPDPQPWTGTKIDIDNFIVDFGAGAGPIQYINQEVVSLSSPEIALIKDIKIYPIPISKYSNQNINITGIDNANIIIRDLFGKTVLTTKLANNKVNISSLIKGIYLLTVNTEYGSITKKIIIN